MSRVRELSESRDEGVVWGNTTAPSQVPGMNRCITSTRKSDSLIICWKVRGHVHGMVRVASIFKSVFHGFFKVFKALFDAFSRSPIAKFKVFQGPSPDQRYTLLGIISENTC